MSKCEVEKLLDIHYKCKNCGYSNPTDFDRECPYIAPHKCKHTGEVVEVLDTKECNCSSRGTNISIHKCNLYNTDCGLLSLLRWRKRKELLDKGVKDCMQCPNRFDK